MTPERVNSSGDANPVPSGCEHALYDDAQPREFNPMGRTQTEIELSSHLPTLIYRIEIDADRSRMKDVHHARRAGPVRR
jgi:hypothetical protein